MTAVPDLVEMMAPAVPKALRNKGMGGHHSASADSEVWLTPPGIIKALGEFDLDPCAAPEPRPWDTARRHYGRAENGLAHPWEGRVWLNPPYGGPSIVGPWLRRMAAHRCGTALIFARTETEAFHETVWNVATGCFFFAGRLHFHYPDGRRADNNAGAPSVLVAYGEADAAALRNSGLSGRYVDLRCP